MTRGPLQMAVLTALKAEQLDSEHAVACIYIIMTFSNSSLFYFYITLLHYVMVKVKCLGNKCLKAHLTSARVD